MKRNEKVLILFIAAAAVALVAGGYFFLKDQGEQIPADPFLTEEPRIEGRPGSASAEQGSREGAAPAEEGNRIRIEQPAEEDPKDPAKLHSSGQVIGRVLDEKKKPLPGVEIILLHETLVRERIDQEPLPQKEIIRTVTDGEGRYFFPRVPALGAYEVAARMEGLAPLSRPRIQVAPGATQEAPDLIMGPGWEIAGLVSLKDGSPVEGAVVFLKSLAGTWIRPDLQLPPEKEGEVFKEADPLYKNAAGLKQARTGPEGEYRFNALGAGSYMIGAWSEGCGLIINKNILLDKTAANGPLQVDFQLEPSVKIQGKVVDREGNALEGVLLAAEKTGDTRFFSMASCLSREKDGSFVLSGIAPGRYILSARKEGYLPSFQTNVEAGAGTHIVVLGNTASLTGIVKAHDTGAPVKEFSLALCSHLGGEFEGGSIIRPWRPFSDPEGRFSLSGLQRGRYVAVARADGYGLGISEPFSMQDGESAGPIAVTLAAGYPLQGKVVDAAGQPVPDARIQLFRGSTQKGRVAQFFGAPGEADREHPPTVHPASWSNAAGEFSFVQVLPGLYNIQVTHPGFETALLEAVEVGKRSANRTDSIQLQRGGSLEGRVLNSQGAPASNALVRIFSSGGTFFRYVRADEAGLFKISRIPPGSYDLIPLTSESAFQGGPLPSAGDPGAGVTVTISEGRTVAAELYVK